LARDDLQACLLHENVYVLSGKYFFWSNPERGQRFIRIALARDTEIFTAAIDVLRGALEEAVR